MRHLLLLCVVAACTDTEEPAAAPAFVLSTTRVDFGKVRCGDVGGTQLTVRNEGDAPFELDAVIDSDEFETPITRVTVDTTIGIPLAARPRTGATTGTLTLSTGDIVRTVQLLVEPEGIRAQLTPAAIDFGNVLPDVTKELTVTASTDDEFSVPITLGTPSTPRFEILGAASATASATANPTFTIRLHSSSQPATHNGTIPITTQAGVCGPTELTLTATTVP